MDVKHPEVEVRLTEMDGNAFNILGLVTNAMQAAGVPHAEREEFYKEATADDYAHLLRTCLKWVKIT